MPSVSATASFVAERERRRGARGGRARPSGGLPRPMPASRCASASRYGGESPACRSSRSGGAWRARPGHDGEQLAGAGVRQCDHHSSGMIMPRSLCGLGGTHEAVAGCRCWRAWRRAWADVARLANAGDDHPAMAREDNLDPRARIPRRCAPQAQPRRRPRCVARGGRRGRRLGFRPKRKLGPWIRCFEETGAEGTAARRDDARRASKLPRRGLEIKHRRRPAALAPHAAGLPC